MTFDATRLHYLAVTERLRILSDGRTDQVVEADRNVEFEIDNVREALSWAVQPGGPGSASPEYKRVGLRLCAAMINMWANRGSFTEALHWYRQAISRAGDDDSPELGRGLTGLSDLLTNLGDYSGALDAAMRSVAMWRRLGDKARLTEALWRLHVDGYHRRRLPARHAAAAT